MTTTATGKRRSQATGNLDPAALAKVERPVCPYVSIIRLITFSPASISLSFSVLLATALYVSKAKQVSESDDDYATKSHKKGNKRAKTVVESDDDDRRRVGPNYNEAAVDYGLNSDEDQIDAYAASAVDGS